MRIQELIIDGFKSYATRTVISDWDESFNCITGLNGSGKSNILDAICFVLGITTMSLVRASNQQDLIYKRGQAGVTKASVTLVFDNSDRLKSPAGFADQPVLSVTRQIVMGGTSKYLLNGHRMQQTDIKKLFQSVQLNIDNPNFLIMQGKITKVLNMRPLELLALVEEAAGTRMFETRRETAMKTMAKKERDIELNQTLLREEIEPKLNKLRNEKRDYLEFQRCQSLVERAERLVYAHDYVQLDQHIADLENERINTSRNLAELKARATALDERAGSQAKSLEDLKERREAEGAMRRLEELEDLQQEAAQKLAKLTAAVEMTSSGLQREKQRLAAAEEAEARAKQALIKHEETAVEFTANYEQLQRDFTAAKAAVVHQQDLLSGLETGISANGQREVGYASEARKAREDIATLQSKMRQSELELEELKRAEDPAVIDRARMAVSELQQKQQALKNQITLQQEQLGGNAQAQQELDALESKERECSQKLSELRRSMDRFKQQYPSLNLDNIPGAGTPAVLGFVAQLFQIRDDHINKATALETAAGGRIFNVVVDSDTTGSKILSSGLKRRTTILPLNKIQAFELPQNRVNAAKHIAPNQIELALDLVDFEQSVAQAVRYVFGSTLICETADSAKRVTYDQNVRSKTITWDGDVYDPQGTLSGGSKREQSSVLLAVRKFCQDEQAFKDLSEEQAILRQKLESARQNTNAARSVQQNIELQQHQLRILTDRLENGSEAAQLKAAESAGTEIKRITEELKQQMAELATLKEKVVEIERDAADFANNRDGKLEDLRLKLSQLKKKESDLLKQLNKDESKYADLDAIRENLVGDAAAQTERAESAKQAITELSKELEGHHENQRECELEQQKAQHNFAEERERLRASDTEVRNLEQSLAASKKEAAEVCREIAKIEADQEALSRRIRNSQEKLRSLGEEHPWLVNERHLLGESGTVYDYFSVDIAQQRAIIETEQKRLGTLNNKVNSMVMSMIESVEKREESLRQMIRQIEHDKRTIESTVVQIDNYKTEALERTYKLVSEDLGNIFGELLPGSSANLKPENGSDISKGLNVNVRLGSVWKDGLAELSGGQRSLVALSLILALLQFRPAPMYILDEVDAALDLHHTQNIGHIIKTKFTGAQFIIVSLKDGMFTNANRIFQTKFQEGTSTVSIMT